MKRTLMMVLALVFVTSSAFAAGSATLNVTATVLGTCSFGAASTLLDLGFIDPLGVVDETGSTTINFTCSNGTPYTFTNPATAVITDGSTPITVNLAYADAGTGTGTGVVTTLTVDGTIPFGTFAAAAPGVYIGNVLLQIDP